MFLQEARNHVRAEGEADASIVFTPASDIFVGVRPKKIAKKAAVRDLQQIVSTHCQHLPIGTGCQKPQQDSQAALKREGRAYVSWSHDTADLLHGVQVGTQTAVHGEDLLVNDGCDGQAVEAVRKCLPQLDVVPALALIVETVDAVNRGALVVATQNEEVLGVLDLVGQEKADRLERLLATVDVVTEEQVVRLWGETAVFEKAEEVIVLTVDVAADLLGLKEWGQQSAQTPGRPAATRGLHKGLLTLIGASSSSRMGWEMKISRALVQRYRISASSSWTCLPGRLPRTSRSRSIIESKSTSC